MPSTPLQNQLLASLPPADFELLRPHLRSFELVQETLLVPTGGALTRAYFPHSGVISLVVNLSAGEMVEAGMVGRDTVFGAAAALDGGIALNNAIVQVTGSASVIDVAQLRGAADQSAPLRATLIRHELGLFAQVQQSAACNASHTVECRLARWLLRVRDLTGSDSFQLTHEFLAQMLAVRRNSVSLVANAFQRAGLIRYRRGNVEITDLEALIDSSCECYGTVKAHYDRLLRRDLDRSVVA